MNDTAPCLYCGGTDYQPLYEGIEDRLGHVPGKWSFMKCQNCGSAMLSPTPKAEDLPAFYPPVYTFAPELAKQGTLKRWLANLEYNIFFRTIYDAQVRLVTRHTNRPKGSPGKLLDIGCGRGLRLRHFQKHGYEVSAMDFTPDSVEYVAKHLSIPAVCTDMDGLATAFRAETFDVISAFYVLEHVVDMQSALAASMQLLKPGGWLAACVPLVDSTQCAFFGKRWECVTEAPRHISLPSQQAIKKACIDAGFKSGSVAIHADSALANSAIASLSMFPSGTTTTVYGGRKLFSLLQRGCAAMAAIGLLPWAQLDRFVFQRPALGLIVAQKPV